MTSGQVVVTGGAGGMGKAVVERLLVDGNRVVAVDHNEDRLEALARQWHDLVTVAVDLSSDDLVERVSSVLSFEEPLTGLVNLAGVSKGSALADLTLEDWQHSFDVNVTAAMRLIQAFAPRLEASGVGSIVNVGSPVGIVGARKPSYAASKAALTGLTMSCARNLGPTGVRVNLLLPGPTITFMTDDWSEERRQAVASGSFLQRLCHPREVAATVAFLLGPESSYITGSTVDMTAGSMLGH